MESLAQLKPALDHHYANNSHHPQYFSNGFNGMDLIDVLEMLIDWKASGERHKDGNIYKSIEINQKRFGISESFCNVLTDTAKILFDDEIGNVDLFDAILYFSHTWSKKNLFNWIATIQEPDMRQMYMNTAKNLGL